MLYIPAILNNALNSCKSIPLGLSSAHPKKPTHKKPRHLGSLNVSEQSQYICTYMQLGLIIQILLPSINSQIYI